MTGSRKKETGYWSFIISGCALFLMGCVAGSKMKEGSAAISKLRLLDVYEMPPALQCKETTVGGLSGIDYDKKRNLYYLISDDRSDINPSRFYTAEIKISRKGIDTVILQEVITLRDKNKLPYSRIDEDPLRRTDPEGIRYNPKTNELVWSNEGERTIHNGQWLLCHPSVTIIDRQGNFRDSFMLPANMRVNPEEKGIRKNGAFEGLSFDAAFRYLYVATEEPLYEDGPRAGLGDSTAWIRIIRFDATTRQQVAQYAYEIDAIPYPANPPGEFKINGVPEILCLDKDQLLVIERSFSTGRQPCAVRVYIADLSAATDVATIPSLSKTSSYKPAVKKLLLNMDELGLYIDNVEGVSFGPVLPNGNRSLIMVTDDNFSARQRTQFFLFEVLR